MGIDLKALKAEQGMSDVDDFDFICYVAYGKKPMTRKERANNVKKKDFFSKYSSEAQSAYFTTSMKERAGGTATPIINRGLWDSLLIPLPPLAEQRRIVAKLEEILPLCERLK